MNRCSVTVCQPMKSRFLKSAVIAALSMGAILMPAKAVTPVNVAFDIVWAVPLPNGDLLSSGSLSYDGDLVPTYNIISLLSFTALVDDFLFSEADDPFALLEFVGSTLVRIEYLGNVSGNRLGLGTVGLGQTGAAYDKPPASITGAPDYVGDIVLKPFAPGRVPDAGSTVVLLGLAAGLVAVFRRSQVS